MDLINTCPLNLHVFYLNKFGIIILLKLMFGLSSSVHCGVPIPPQNGTIVNYTSTVEGSTLLYQCNPGFGPVGEMTAVCSGNGS